MTRAWLIPASVLLGHCSWFRVDMWPNWSNGIQFLNFCLNCLGIKSLSLFTGLTVKKIWGLELLEASEYRANTAKQCWEKDRNHILMPCVWAPGSNHTWRVTEFFRDLRVLIDPLALQKNTSGSLNTIRWEKSHHQNASPLSTLPLNSQWITFSAAVYKLGSWHTKGIGPGCSFQRLMV